VSSELEPLGSTEPSPANRPTVPLWLRVFLGAVGGLGAALFGFLGLLDVASGEALRRAALALFVGGPMLGASGVYGYYRNRGLGPGRSGLRWLATGAGAGGATGALLFDLHLIPAWGVGVGVVAATGLSGLLFAACSEAVVLSPGDSPDGTKPIEQTNASLDRGSSEGEG